MHRYRWTRRSFPAHAHNTLINTHTHINAQVLLNQTAFLLMLSVLLDTFVVRTFLVPILMTFTNAHTWWPRKGLPTPTKDLDM